MDAIKLSVTGDKQLLAALQAIKDRAIPDVIVPAIQNVSNDFAKLEAELAPKRTGILAAAIGSTKPKVYQHYIVFATSGARGGFAKRRSGGKQLAYARGIKWKRLKSGKMVLTKASKAETKSGDDLVSIEIPTKIAHFAEEGRGEVRPKKKKALFDSATGTFFGAKAKGYEGTHFMERAKASLMPMAQAYLFGEIYQRLPELAKEVMAKGG
jgi:hypothetical protein